MTTIAAGSTASVYCPLPCTITLTPTASATYRVVAQNGDGEINIRRITVATTFSVDAGSTVFMQAVGEDATYTDPAAQAAAVVAGLPSIGSQASNFASIGDSISSGAFNIVVPTTRETRGKGFISWAQALSNHRFSVVDVQCVGGAWVGSGGAIAISLDTQMGNVIDNGLAAQVLICGGINDIIGDRTAAEVFADLEAIIAKGLAAGLSLWVCTVPPIGVSYGSYSVARQGQLLAYNERIRGLRYLENTNRFFVVDLFAAAVNPTAAAPTLIGTYDNLHPNNAAGYRMGKALAARMNAVIPAVDSLISSNADNYGYSSDNPNIIDNGLFVNGSGTATGFTASVSGASHTPSLEARADGFGNYQRLTATSSATSQHSRLSTGDLKARTTFGDMLVAECEVVITAPTNLRCVRLTLTITGSVTTHSTSDFQLDSTNDVALPEAYSCVLRTYPIEVASSQGTISAISAQVTQFFVGAGGATLDIGRFSLRKS